MMEKTIRKNRINIAVEAGKKVQYEEMAKAMGLNLSSYIRVLILLKRPLGDVTYHKEEKFNEVISIFLTDAEKRLLQTIAESEGMSPSKYIRLLMEELLNEWVKY